MARINIDDTLFSDPRFLRLCIQVGNEYAAIGMMVMAIKLAEKFWVPQKLPIPNEAWKASRLGQAIIECGLAEVAECGGIYLCGSEKAFDWRFKKAQAGRKGGLAKASSAKHNQALLDQNSEQVEQAMGQNGLSSAKHNQAQPSTTKQNVASSSSSFSLELPQTPSGFGNGGVSEIHETPKALLKPDDPIQAFENRMRGNDNAWLEVLSKIYAPHPPDSGVLRMLAKIRAHYANNVDHFKLEMEELWQSAEGKDSERKYITVGLKRKLGMISEMGARQ